MPDILVPELVYHGTRFAVRRAGYSTGWRRVAGIVIEAAVAPGWLVECRGRPAWSAAAGEGHVILPHTEHRLSMVGADRLSTWTVLDCTWSDGSDPLAGQHGALRIPAAAMRRICRHQQHLIAMQDESGWAAGLRRQQLLHELVLALDLPWNQVHVPDPRIRAAMALVDADPERRFSCRELAERAGLGLAQFHALFLRDVGLPPLLWMSRRRVRLAQQLLAGTSLPVARIAERCGFACPFHFSRVFRRHSRQSPRAFRRALATG
jgi:AraC-like DNA-binding protein